MRSKPPENPLRMLRLRNEVRNYQKLRNSIEALAVLEPVSQSEARILGWGRCPF